MAEIRAGHSNNRVPDPRIIFHETVPEDINPLVTKHIILIMANIHVKLLIYGLFV